jgi:hypothetical protein
VVIVSFLLQGTAVVVGEPATAITVGGAGAEDGRVA